MQPWNTALARLTLPFVLGCVLGLLVSAKWVDGAARADQASSASEPVVAAEPAGVEPASEPAAAASSDPIFAATATAQAVESPLGPGEDVVVLLGQLDEGQTLSDALRTYGVSSRTVHEIATGLRGLFDFRYSQPGDEYRLIQGREGTLLEFHYATSPYASYRLYRDGEAYMAERRETDLERRMARIAGVVDSSLYEAVTALGASAQLATDFADVFAWDVDFSRAVRSGDEFRILYERLFRKLPDGEEAFVGPGRILAARYEGAAGSHEAIYFETSEGHGGYYRPDGSSVERQFLKAPVKYGRISSRYSTSRLHPVLKTRRPHHGIDYAAPMRTPVWAVADGRVVFKGWNGGLGKLVKIEHPNGYVTYYGHLSGYAEGIAVGRHVSQKQVIGYVGQTGLATGPHVCFRIARDGQYVDPSRLQTQAGPPVAPEVLPLFFAARDVLLAELVGGTPARLTAESPGRG